MPVTGRVLTGSLFTGALVACTSRTPTTLRCSASGVRDPIVDILELPKAPRPLDCSRRLQRAADIMDRRRLRLRIHVGSGGVEFDVDRPSSHRWSRAPPPSRKFCLVSAGRVDMRRPYPASRWPMLLSGLASYIYEEAKGLPRRETDYKSNRCGLTGFE